MDRDLVERARSGDQQAFADLVHQVSDTLFGVARRILRDPGLAEDVLQNALVTIWRKLPHLLGQPVRVVGRPGRPAVPDVIPGAEPEAGAVLAGPEPRQDDRGQPVEDGCLEVRARLPLLEDLRDRDGPIAQLAVLAVR
jgi:hypothetical protein